MKRLAQISYLVFWGCLCFSLISRPGFKTGQGTRLGNQPNLPEIFLTGNITEEAQITLSVAVASMKPESTFLMDSPGLSTYLADFLGSNPSARLIPIGYFGQERVALEQRLHIRCPEPIPVDSTPLPPELWDYFYPQADQVIVCPAEPRSQLLQAACLAGSLKSPLWIIPGNGSRLQDQDQNMERFQQQLIRWGTTGVTLIGEARELKLHSPSLRRRILGNEFQVARAHRAVLAANGPIETIVAANPEDQNRGNHSILAPWMCLQKRASLLLTDSSGTNLPFLVNQASQLPVMSQLDAVVLFGNLQAIPVEQRINPIPKDKDPLIDMEPLTPGGTKPFTYSVGRLFHEDQAAIPLLLARQAQLIRSQPEHRRVLIASNSGGSLPLLETFSRNTAEEFRNNGYETTTLFGDDVDGPLMRRLLMQQDIFLWEGHHNVLIRDYSFPTWNEPLPPVLVFLQSCLALKDYKVHPVLGRGAIGVIGASTRTYSASGGACSLAFFDAILYENQSVGGALREAKNFLLAYSLLKEKRLGLAASHTGANQRAAWAFSLWGDPTLRLPAPKRPEQSRPPVRFAVENNTIVVKIPDNKSVPIKTRRGEEPGYRTEMPANGRLAGLISKQRRDETGTPLVPFFFAEIPLPQAPVDRIPVLHSRIASSRYVFCWDPRRRSGYLLVTPQKDDKSDLDSLVLEPQEHELRFRIEWQMALPRNSKGLDQQLVFEPLDEQID